jgi:hypothetical protein
VHHVRIRQRDAGALRAQPCRVELATRRDVVGRPEHESDVAVAELRQVVPGQLDGDRVVGRHRRERQVRHGRADEDGRDPQLGEPQVVVVRRVLLRVLATDEDHAGDLLLQEQLDVVRLGDAAGALRAEHRGVAVLGEPAADELAEGGEDRVLQLGQEQADQAGALAPQLARSLVSEHVERRQHGLTSRVAHAGLLVEHAAHRRLAHPDLLGHLGESSRHAQDVTQSAQVLARWVSTGSTTAVRSSPCPGCARSSSPPIPGRVSP